MAYTVINGKTVNAKRIPDTATRIKIEKDRKDKLSKKGKLGLNCNRQACQRPGE